MSRKVHFIGIGGAGLSAIARILADRGEIISGSDRERSPYADALESLGIRISYAHLAENIQDQELVIISSAIPHDNVELAAAREKGIRILRREEYLDELLNGYRTIAVAGTHGKTTTTGLITWILTQTGHDPSYIVGGVLSDLGSNAGSGGSPFFVIEADEYDRAFLGIHPEIAVITTVEHDHPDCYPTAADFQTAFQTFANQVSGHLILCADDPAALALQSDTAERSLYGMSRDADWTAQNIRPDGMGGQRFDVVFGTEIQAEVETALLGKHNVHNILAALAAVHAAGVPLQDALPAVKSFHGVTRRFEILAEVDGTLVVDDYAHHPTEIRTTLAGARAGYPDREIWAVFQPHTYSRLRTLFDDFINSFEDADHVLVTDVFAARERRDPEMNGKRLAADICHDDVEYIADFSAAAAFLAARVGSNSLVITLSAGDANQIGYELLDRLKEKRRHPDVG